MSAPARPIVVVLDGPPTPAWQARALAGLQALDAVEVVELKLAGALRRSAAQRLRSALERHVFRLGPDPHAPVLLPATAPAPGRAATLVVWLAERPPPQQDRGELLWLRQGGSDGSLEDVLAAALRAGLACVETDVLLRRAGATVLVARTVSEVRPFAETRSRTLTCWKLAAMLPRAVACLPGLDLPASETCRAEPPPAGGALLARAAVSLTRALATRLLFRRPWSILVRPHAPDLAGGWGEDAGLVRWAAANSYADPFLFEHDGHHHLFCEEVARGSRLGVICHTELRLDGVAARAPKRVLQAPYHLSYPFVFAHGGEVFMVPETSTARRVELYRAVAFPDRWEREGVLLEDIDATDATLLSHDGRLWMFASVAAADASSDELHLFWAPAPRGPWHAHAGNPVVSDVRCARPAGAIQRRGARLVRPCQDCSRRYGWALSFRQIDVLTSEAYAEHEIARIEPADLPDARATHTYAADSRFEAIDVRRRHLRARRAR